jgi:hypothetical protein
MGLDPPGWVAAPVPGLQELAGAGQPGWLARRQRRG